MLSNNLQQQVAPIANKFQHSLDSRGRGTRSTRVAAVHGLLDARPHDPRSPLDGGVVGHPLVGPLELLIALVPGLRPEHVADGRAQQELQHLVSRHRGC